MRISSSPFGDTVKWQPRATLLRLRSVCCLFAIDISSILAGFGIAIVIRNALFGGTNWQFLLLTLIPTYVVVALNNHAYDRSNLRYPFRAIRRGLQALTIAIAVTVLIGVSLKANENLPRFVTVVGFILSSSAMFVGRYAFARHFEIVIGGDPFRVILIHDSERSPPTERYLTIIAADADFDPTASDPIMYDRLSKTLQGADRVVVTCDIDRREAWAHALKGMSVQGEIIVPELASLAPLGVADYGDMPTMVVSIGQIGLVDRAIKRAFDLTLTLTVLIALSPLFIVVSLAIKLDSKGGVLFRQTRIGQDNKMFKVIKFRSMYDAHSDSAGHRSASRQDDRVTRVGRLIRSTSIDELPQLFNVLTGEMSIVGPRPHALGSRAADKLFWEVDHRYWHRHRVKPGLTGLAQVRGFRGATLEEADLSNRLQADLEYLENWSIWRDVKIIILTFRVLLHRNAF